MLSEIIPCLNSARTLLSLLLCQRVTFVFSICHYYKRQRGEMKKNNRHSEKLFESNQLAFGIQSLLVVEHLS